MTLTKHILSKWGGGYKICAIWEIQVFKILWVLYIYYIYINHILLKIDTKYVPHIVNIGFKNTTEHYEVLNYFNTYINYISLKTVKRSAFYLTVIKG